MLRTLFAILLFLFSLGAEAAYVRTEIDKVVKLKVAGNVVGLRIHWSVVDDFHVKPPPTADNPNPVHPINGVAIIKGQNYTDFQAANAAGKKALVWSIIRPDIAHFYRNQAQQPTEAEEDDASSPVAGQLTTQTP